MDRRQHSRSQADKLVTVRVFGEDARDVTARAVDISGSGMKLVCDAAIAPGTAVRITMDDSLVLAEICYCRAEEQHYVLGAKVDQVLAGLSNLARFNRRLFGIDEVETERREPIARRAS